MVLTCWLHKNREPSSSVLVIGYARLKHHVALSLLSGYARLRRPQVVSYWLTTWAP